MILSKAEKCLSAEAIQNVNEEDLKKDEKYSPMQNVRRNKKYLLLAFILVSPSFSFFTPAFQLIADINKFEEGAKGWTHERGMKCYRCRVIVPEKIYNEAQAF